VATKPIRVAIYLRVSKDDGSQETDNQLLQLRDFCESWDGHELVAEYVDRESGTRGRRERRDFDRMFADAARRRFEAGEGVGIHTNDEVDVVFVGIMGSGTVTVDGERFALGPGQLVFVPKGCLRAARSGPDEFAYLTVHRRRGPERLAPKGARGRTSANTRPPEGGRSHEAAPVS
jgi:mannose-6-phosphate isomerase-like protein (cupin superfamily)